jgi:hypothetical protein
MGATTQQSVAQNDAQVNTPVEQSVDMNDRRFMKRVVQVLALRDFIVREMQDTQKSAPTKLSCEGLYAFKFARSGREPKETEWNALEGKYFDLNEFITSDQRKKFILSQFPLVIIYIALVSLTLSMASLLYAVYPNFISIAENGDSQSFIRMLAFVLWNICLGALGSIAFISVNALSMQSDATFDVSNTRFVLLRIILGALFGVLIALPVGYDEFLHFCLKLSVRSTEGSTDINASQALYLLLPFLVGFSASLFMTIISKFIAGVQSLFGVEGQRSSPAQPGQASSSLPTPRSMMG